MPQNTTNQDGYNNDQGSWPAAGPVQQPYPQNQQQGQYSDPYAQQTNDPYQQNQQNQYPGQYQQPGYRSYQADDYLTYDQKASRIVGGVLGTIFVAVVVIGLIWYYRAMHPAPVPTPVGYTQFYVGDGGFSIAQPVGWNTDSGGANGVESNATFTSGKAKIFADSDLSGSLTGDILTANNNQQQGIADELGKRITLTPPVVTIHREEESTVAADYTNYSEQPMQPFTCPLGEGWYSEFTAVAGTFTGKVHGYRATLLDNERRVDIITVCRVSDWPALQGAFMHELESLDRGKSSP